MKVNCLKLSICKNSRKLSTVYYYRQLPFSYYDGEGISQSTKRMEIMIENEADYGRRIDLLVKIKESDTQYDLCSNEFKKDGISNDIKHHQQSKSIRINTYIMDDLNLLHHEKGTVIVNFDFEGRKSYLVQIFSYEDYLVAYKVGNFIIPKTIQHLDNFRSSIINIFCWKEVAINNKNNSMAALVREEDELSYWCR